MESIIREKEVYVTEVNTWRIMAFLSDVLQHLHRHRSGPILARGLSPASLQSVCIPSERGTMAYDFRLSHLNVTETSMTRPPEVKFDSSSKS